jgi:hypothetical protein
MALLSGFRPPLLPPLATPEIAQSLGPSTVATGSFSSLRLASATAIASARPHGKADRS